MMDNKRSLLGTVYFWAWHDVLKLKKPITGLTQEEQRANPLAFMLLFLALGIVMVKWSKAHWWQCLIWLGLGILFGHLFW